MAKLRPIPGFGGRYSVTNTGMVWSNVTRRWRKPHTNHNGYMFLTLSNGRGSSKSRAVHKLLALAWMPNPRKYNCVNHKDGNKTNNKLSNLEWCSKSADLRHAWDTGLRKVTQKMRDSMQVTGRKRGIFAPRQIRRMRELKLLGLNPSEIANVFCTTRENVKNILNGNNYGHIK